MAVQFASKCRVLYDEVTRPLILLSAVWLALFSTILPHQGEDSLEKFSGLHFQVVLALLAAIWLIFAADYCLLLLAPRGEGGFCRRASLGLLVLVFPVFRAGVSGFCRPGQIWIPGLGWRVKGKLLERTLAEKLGFPMILVALLVLPILGVEYLRPEWLEHRAVRIALAMGSQAIWLAFAAEFAVMISVTSKKLMYCAKHWLDLAIILLPVILFVIPCLGFLPLLRLGRLARVGSVVRSTRLLRLRGVGLKAFQALVLVSGTRRFGGRLEEKRIKRLKEQIVDLEEDLAILKAELTTLEEEREQKLRAWEQDARDLHGTEEAL